MLRQGRPNKGLHDHFGPPDAAPDIQVQLVLPTEQPAQERVTVAFVAVFLGAPLVALHALARGLVLVGQMLLVEFLLQLLHLLGVLLFLFGLDLLLLLLADAFLGMHHGSNSEDQQQHGEEAEDRAFHSHGAANIVPGTHTYLCIAACCMHTRLLMRVRNLSFLAALALVLAPGCKKDRDVQVPLTAVDIAINVNLPAYNALAVTGGWVYLTGGSQGILVYRNMADGPSDEVFTALDRHCTYQPENLCRVTVDADGIIARDTVCCGSAFLLMDGSVVNGPAALGLKQYHTTFNGQTLHIFN